MAYIPQNRRSRRIFLLILAGSLLIAILTLLPLAVAPPLSTITSSLSAFAAYDPATYGIPYQIGGFKVLAIKTSENTGCISSGMMTVKIQSSQPDVQSVLANSGDTRIVYETLQQIPSLNNIQFILEVSGPVPWNPQQFMSEIAKWNEATKNGCLQLGPAQLPTLDPFTPYAPATFGLPEIVAGYRIVMVQTSGNTPCMAVNQIRLTIQAVDPSPYNPMVARDGGDIIFEVKKLHPDIDWQLQYIMPQPVNQIDRERFVASMQEWNKAGCVKLGGPEFTPTPVL